MKYFMHKKYLNKYIALFIIIVFLNSCNYLNKIIGQKPDLFDGKYNVTCISKGIPVAIADIDVNDGIVSGFIINTNSQYFDIKGKVNSDGVIDFLTLKVSSGEKVLAEGMIDSQGITKGNYTVGDRRGEYIGFRYSEFSDITSIYDGLYSITLNRDGVDIATQEVVVKNGYFECSVKTNYKESYNIDGMVLNNGKIIIYTEIGDKSTGIVAIGSISDENIVRGSYYTHKGDKGDFKGYLVNKILR